MEMSKGECDMVVMVNIEVGMHVAANVKRRCISYMYHNIEVCIDTVVYSYGGFCTIGTITCV